MDNPATVLRGFVQQQENALEASLQQHQHHHQQQPQQDHEASASQNIKQEGKRPTQDAPHGTMHHEAAPDQSNGIVSVQSPSNNSHGSEHEQQLIFGHSGSDDFLHVLQQQQQQQQQQSSHQAATHTSIPISDSVSVPVTAPVPIASNADVQPVITALETLNSAMASAVASATASSIIMANAPTTTTTPTSTTTSTSRPVSTALAATSSKSAPSLSELASSYPRSVPSSSASAAVAAIAATTSGTPSNGSNTPTPHYMLATDAANHRFDKCPALFKCSINDWEAWLEREKTHTRWNLIRHRHRDKQTFARGPTASEWSREYQCDHAGQYRDRKNPNVDPSKKRKRTGSIKCNCPAFIKMRKHFVDEDVVIEYYWKHEGHIPDVMEDIKAHRLPQDLKAWIKRRVEEGREWKPIKTMLTSGSPLLDELHPTTRENVKSLMQACYGHYANTARLWRKNNNIATRSPSVQSSEGTPIQLESGDQEIPLAIQSASHMSSTSPSSSSSSSSASSSSSSLSHSHLDQQVSSTSSSTSTFQKQQEQKDVINHAQVAPWRIVGLNTVSGEPIHANQHHSDDQTLAVHNLSTSTMITSSASGSSDEVTHDHNHNHLHQQALRLGEPLLNAESISSVIHEKEEKGGEGGEGGKGAGGAQEMAGLSLVGTSSTDSPISLHHQQAPDLASTNTLEASSRVLYSSRRGDSRNHTPAEQQPDQPPLPSQQQQEQQQPREMMLEMLRAIGELYKQLEATEEYVTQEDAIEIIESFALPIRLMKEALERRRELR